jgi:hypothetical protein
MIVWTRTRILHQQQKNIEEQNQAMDDIMEFQKHRYDDARKGCDDAQKSFS